MLRLWFSGHSPQLNRDWEEDGGHRENSSQTRANTYFYPSQSPLRPVGHRWTFYSTPRMPLTGPRQMGRHSDLTSIFTWQSKDQKVALQTWALWPAAMWAAGGMHKHSKPSKQPSRKVHSDARKLLDLCPSQAFKPGFHSCQASNKSGKPGDRWGTTQKSGLNQPDEGLYITQRVPGERGSALIKGF